MKPTPAQLLAGRAAYFDATRLKSMKANDAEVIAAIYDAMTAEHLMPVPLLVPEAPGP